MGYACCVPSCCDTAARDAHRARGFGTPCCGVDDRCSNSTGAAREPVEAALHLLLKGVSLDECDRCEMRLVRETDTCCTVIVVARMLPDPDEIPAMVLSVVGLNEPGEHQHSLPISGVGDCRSHVP